MAVAIAKASMSLAAVRPATPRPARSIMHYDSSSALFDKEVRRSQSPVKKEATAALPAEAEQLKQQIRRKWPVSTFRFRFRFMRRVVVSPVQIPKEFAHARAWAAMVSGIRIPLTKMMWQRQRRKLLHRMPDTIHEGVSY